MKRLAFLLWVDLSLTLGACSKLPQPPMTPAQASAYNQCMQSHWSSFADTALFGIGGYEYHQNVVLGCQQFALIGERSAQPAAAAQPVSVPTTSVQPASSSQPVPLTPASTSAQPAPSTSPGTSGLPAAAVQPVLVKP